MDSEGKEVWMVSNSVPEGSLVAWVRKERSFMISSEQRVEEQRALAHPYEGILEKAAIPYVRGDLEEAARIVKCNNGAFSNLYIKLWYASMTDDRGKLQTCEGNFKKAEDFFCQAERMSDSIEGKFDSSRWNAEIDLLRIITRKHRGDCYFRRATEAHVNGAYQPRDFFKSLSEKKYEEVDSVWRKRLRNVKEMFRESVINMFDLLSQTAYNLAALKYACSTIADTPIFNQNILRELAAAKHHTASAQTLAELCDRIISTYATDNASRANVEALQGAAKTLAERIKGAHDYVFSQFRSL